MATISNQVSPHKRISYRPVYNKNSESDKSGFDKEKINELVCAAATMEIALMITRALIRSALMITVRKWSFSHDWHAIDLILRAVDRQLGTLKIRLKILFCSRHCSTNKD